jgi:glycogen operon protein
LTGDYDETLGVRDVTWINATGAEMRAEDWDNEMNRSFAMLLDGRAQPSGIRRPGEELTVLVILNGYHDLVVFTLPEAPGGKFWTLLIDTNAPEREDEPVFEAGHAYQVTGRSLVLFALQAVTAS